MFLPLWIIYTYVILRPLRHVFTPHHTQGIADLAEGDVVFYALHQEGLSRPILTTKLRRPHIFGYRSLQKSMEWFQPGFVLPAIDQMDHHGDVAIHKLVQHD